MQCNVSTCTLAVSRVYFAIIHKGSCQCLLGLAVMLIVSCYCQFSGFSFEQTKIWFDLIWFDDQSDAGGSVEMTVSVECSANESGTTTWHHVKGLWKQFAQRWEDGVEDGPQSGIAGSDLQPIEFILQLISWQWRDWPDGEKHKCIMQIQVEHKETSSRKRFARRHTHTHRERERERERERSRTSYL